MVSPAWLMAIRQGRKVHGGGLQFHAGLGHVGGQHGGQQVGNGVAGGVGPGDDQGLQLAVDILVAGAGAGVRGAVGIQGPAVLFQQLLGGVDVHLVVVQVLGQPVGVLGVLGLGQAVGSVHNGSVAAGVLTGELVAVQAVSDGLTDVLAVGGELAAVELDLAVAVAVEGGVVAATPSSTRSRPALMVSAPQLSYSRSTLPASSSFIMVSLETVRTTRVSMTGFTPR